MEKLFKSLKPAKRSGKAKVKRKRYKLYPDIPYDPQLAPGALENQPISKDWKITPGLLNLKNENGKLSAPKDIVNLLNKGQSGKGYKSNTQIQHLFSRASFGISVEEAQTLSSSTTEEWVDVLLNPQMPAPPDVWVDEPFDINEYRNWTQEQRQAFLMLNRDRMNELRGWWLQLMMASPVNLQEKMTLFWHGIFTSDLNSSILAQLAYKQNNSWREHSMGNLRTFLKSMYKDPTMLFYLNGVDNVAAEPNENFARELLELFTMGVGNYTETDIKEAARALTGWQVDFYHLTSLLNPNLHDNGSKTFFGQTGNFDGDDIIDIILEQPQTAVYICRRLYEFFVSREVDNDFVTNLANTFRSNNYEIKPVLREIFTSTLFYSEEVRSSLIKSPVDLTMSNIRMLSPDSVDLFAVLFFQAIIDQELMNPPNVAGWPGQRAWISPTTYVLRNTVSEIFVSKDLLKDQTPFDFDPIKFAQSFNLPEARELTAAMVTHLARLPVSEQQIDFFVTVLLGTASEDDWSLAYPGADRLVTACLVQILRLPEFHLS